MSTGKRILIIVAACVAFILLSWGLVFGTIFATGGLITVRVLDPSENLNLFIPVPAALASAAVGAAESWVPAEELKEWQRVSSEWRPAIREMLEVVEDLPDVTLVEVIDHNDHVTVRMKSGMLVVRVNDSTATIQVSIPARLAKSTVLRLMS